MDRHNFHRGMVWLWGKDPDAFRVNFHLIVKMTCYKSLLTILKAIVHPASLEADYDAAVYHKAMRREMRTDIQKTLMKGGADKTDYRGNRRMARERRQAQVKRDFAASIGQKLEDIWVPAKGSHIAVQNRINGVSCPVDGPPEGREFHPTKCFNRGRWVGEGMLGRFHEFIKARDEGLKRGSEEKKLLQGINIIVRTACLGDREEWLKFAVAEEFVTGIADDLDAIDAGKSVSGLAAKWSPKPEGHFDKWIPGLVDSIAEGLIRLGKLNRFPGGRKCIKYQQARAAVGRAAKIPEHFVGTGDWALVDYARMPARCRLIYGDKIFKKHDPERFQAYLDLVAEGRAKIATGGVMPHEICKAALEGSDVSCAFTFYLLCLFFLVDSDTLAVVRRSHVGRQGRPAPQGPRGPRYDGPPPHLRREPVDGRHG